MFYADVKDLPEGPFKRLTGVRPATFLDMCDALERHLPSGGRAPKLRLEDRLLLTLMYWREYRTEYRTQYHIGQTYGLSESAVCRTIRTAEDALTRSGRFPLPGRKALTRRALTRSDIAFEVVVVDATECPCERPKKNSAKATAARRSATPKKRRSSRTRRRGASS